MCHKEYVAIICGVFAKSVRDALPLIQYRFPWLYLSSYLMLPVCAHSVMRFCSGAQQMSQDYCMLASLALTAD